MKKLLILLIFVVLSTISYAQTYKFQTKYVCLRAQTDGLWSDYTQWLPSEPQILVDIPTQKVEINSEFPQFYTINIVEEGVNPDFVTLELWCKDLQGQQCVLEFVKRDKGIYQLYIRYTDLEIIYEIYPYD